MDTCPNCSADIDDAAESCPECGQVLREADERDEALDPRTADEATRSLDEELAALAAVTPPADDAEDEVAPDEPEAAAEPVRPRKRHRVAATIAAACILAVVAALAIAVLAWPQARLLASSDALARVTLPGFAGRVTAIGVRAADGSAVPVRSRQGQLWPVNQLAPGARLTVAVTVRRPDWAAWLVGHQHVARFTIVTPSAHLRATWLSVQSGARVTVAFDAPVAVVELGSATPRILTPPQATVDVGRVASGASSASDIQVAAAARSWETLPAPVRVSWFAAKPYPQMLVEPGTTAKLGPRDQITLTFSDTVDAVLGSKRPKFAPSVPGRWSQLDAHTLAFQPTGSGFGLGATVKLTLPRAVHLAKRGGSKLTRSVGWHVPPGSTLRLEQLLAQLGYLPLTWKPASGQTTMSAEAQLDAAVSPPAGQFTWTYPHTPPELQALWTKGTLNKIAYGAVMVFEDTHHIGVDGLAGSTVWSKLIADAVAGKTHTGGYNYVFVHRNVPQLLSLWHNGKVIQTSPGNTGVPAAPTQLGTFPVFEHIPVGTMSGTNPDGSQYNDPGIRWISYFDGGEALHSFNRASFGTPQSLGCVELPLAAAAKLWPYTPIGTLVTIEN
jgi:hypothetical protein